MTLKGLHVSVVGPQRERKAHWHYVKIYILYSDLTSEKSHYIIVELLLHQISFTSSVVTFSSFIEAFCQHARPPVDNTPTWLC